MTQSPPTPTPSPDVVATHLAGGETVLLDVATGHYVKLNRTAAVIWSGIEDGDPLEAIAKRLSKTYEVEQAGAEASVMAFLRQLEQAGLISVPET